MTDSVATSIDPVPDERTAGSQASAPTAPTALIDKLAIVIVTYKRQELLSQLFDSLCTLTQAPWRVIVIDNEHSPETAQMVADLDARMNARWGVDAVLDAEGSSVRVRYEPQEDNLGGAGGFSAGVKRAYELGAQWFWVMDDDVFVMPDALDKLAPWTRDHLVIQGSRLDHDGGPFYWQYHFIVPLGIPNPLAPAAFDESGHRAMNTLCFEGGLFERRIVDQIGFPDPRFFIYWDDTVYGYLASTITDPIVTADIVLQRSRSIANWDIAGLRQLNSTSDLNRYYIMRNRGYMMQYFRLHGDFNRFLFGLGTAATLAKELIRLVAVDRTFKTGLPALFKGMRDARAIYRDRTWKPMPPAAAPKAAS